MTLGDRDGLSDPGYRLRRGTGVSDPGYRKRSGYVDLARRLGREGLRDRGDVVGGVAAAAAGDVEQAARGELAEETAHVGGQQVEAGRRERIGQAGVRVARDERVGLLAQLLEERAHEIGAEGAVEAHGERLDVADGVPERANRLRGDHRLAAAADGSRDHEREFDFVLGEHLFDRHERALGVEGVEDRFHQQEVHATGDERAHLAAVVGLHLVEGDDAEAGVVGVGRIGERDGQRPDGAGDVAAAAGGVGDAVSPLAALAGGLEIDVVGQFLQELVLDDGLVERRVLATALLARVLDEELALPDARGRKGIGLDDVRAGLEEAAVDIADFIGAGEGIDIAVVLEILRGVLETFAARVFFREIIAAGWSCPWRHQ